MGSSKRYWLSSIEMAPLPQPMTARDLTWGYVAASLVGKPQMNDWWSLLKRYEKLEFGSGLRSRIMARSIPTPTG